MSIYFTGKAQAVAQVSSVQIGAYDAATTYSLTINGVSVTSLAAGSANLAAAALVSAWNSSDHPYFTPITAALDTSVSPSDTITLTGDEAGFPFTVTSSVSGGSGAIGAVSETTAATGKYHWNDADNWSGLAVPDDGDDVIIELTGARICWGLDRSGQSPTPLLASLVVRGDVRIGLSKTQVATFADGETVSSSAPEYRDDYLQIAITRTEIGPNRNTATPSGSGRVKIHNLATAAATATVSATASTPVDLTLPAIRFLASSANFDVFVDSARAGVGIAIEAGETATVGDVHLVDRGSVSQLFTGAGLTLSSVVQHGGRSTLDAAATFPAITVTGGTAEIEGIRAITALTVDGGAVHLSTTGTTTTLTQNGGTVDTTRLAQARTVTTWTYNEGARNVDYNVLTITNDNRAGRVTEVVSAL